MQFGAVIAKLVLTYVNFYAFQPDYHPPLVEWIFPLNSIDCKQQILIDFYFWQTPIYTKYVHHLKCKLLLFILQFQNYSLFEKQGARIRNRSWASKYLQVWPKLSISNSLRGVKHQLYLSHFFFICICTVFVFVFVF